MSIVRKVRNSIILILSPSECRSDRTNTASRKHVKNLLAAAAVLAELLFLFRLNALSLFKGNTKEQIGTFAV